MVSRANNIGTELNDDNLNTLILEPGCVCTESYMIIGADLKLNESECQNMCSYLHTKFVRFLHSLAKSSQDATSKTYRFIPMQDMKQEWNDAMLYVKYGLSDSEIELIESTILPM